MRVKANIEQSIEKLSDFINEKLESKETILKLDDEMTKEDKENPKVVSANKALKMVSQISNIYIKMEKEQRAQEKADRFKIQETISYPAVKKNLSVIEHIEGITKHIIVNKFIPEAIRSSTKEKYWGNLKKVFNLEECIRDLVDACDGIAKRPPKPRNIRRAEEKQRLKEIDKDAQLICQQHGNNPTESDLREIEWGVTEMVAV